MIPEANGHGLSDEPLKVLLVDDEYMVLDTLLSLIRWDELGLKVVATAMNGKIALEKCALHQPDLIVTDLTMPVMNGIELMETLSRDYPHTRFAVLTAHKDFEYAQRAVEMRALGYLLKTPMNAEAIERTLQKCAETVRLEHRLQRRVRRAEHIQAQHMWAMRGRVLDDLLRGTHIGAEPLADVFPWYARPAGSAGCDGVSSGVGGRASAYIALYMTLEERQQFFAQYPESDRPLLDYTMRQAALETIAELGVGTVLPYRQGELVLVVGLPTPESKAQSESLLHQLCDRLALWFLRYFGAAARFGVGETASELGQMKRAITEAIAAAEAAFYEPAAVHYHYWTASRIWNKGDRMDWDVLEQRVLAGWGSSSVEDRLNGLRELREFVRQNRPLPGLLKQRAVHWLESVHSVTLHRLDWSRLADNVPHDVWFETLEKLLTRVPRQEPQLYDGLHPDIGKAIQYIYEHLGDNVTLSRVAEHIHMNPSYLSHLFKEETGENFLDFLTLQRIGKAKEYLASGKYKNYELAEKTGFISYPHFCTLFKKLTGMTPSEYRKRQTQ